MGGQQSQVKSGITSFHPVKYAGRWFTVTGERKKICHHWDANNKKMNIVISDIDIKAKTMVVASIDLDKVGHLQLDTGYDYIIHWTDYNHYSFVTLNKSLYVLSRTPHIRKCETELISLALKGCGLDNSLTYIVEKEKDKVNRGDDLFDKSDFWSEIGKNFDSKNTYESKFSN